MCTPESEHATGSPLRDPVTGSANAMCTMELLLEAVNCGEQGSKGEAARRQSSKTQPRRTGVKLPGGRAERRSHDTQEAGVLSQQHPLLQTWHCLPVAFMDHDSVVQGRDEHPGTRLCDSVHPCLSLDQEAKA